MTVPTPLDQLPFEDLARRACEVMGYEIEGCRLRHPIVFPDTPPPQVVRFIDDEWGLFGLAVEWIEARGGRISMEEPVKGDRVFGVLGFTIPQFVYGDSYPAAALRWVVEHGDKIKEAKP